MRSDPWPAHSCAPPLPPAPSATFPSREIQNQPALPKRAALAPTPRPLSRPLKASIAMCWCAGSFQSIPGQSTEPVAHPVGKPLFSKDRKPPSARSLGPPAQNRPASAARLAATPPASCFHLGQKEINPQLRIPVHPRRAGIHCCFWIATSPGAFPITGAVQKIPIPNQRSESGCNRHFGMWRIADSEQLDIHLRQHASAIHSRAAAAFARVPDMAIHSQHRPRALRNQYVAKFHVKCIRPRLPKPRLHVFATTIAGTVTPSITIVRCGFNAVSRSRSAI